MGCVGPVCRVGCVGRGVQGGMCRVGSVYHGFVEQGV